VQPQRETKIRRGHPAILPPGGAPASGAVLAQLARGQVGVPGGAGAAQPQPTATPATAISTSVQGSRFTAGLSDRATILIKH